MGNKNLIEELAIESKVLGLSYETALAVAHFLHTDEMKEKMLAFLKDNQPDKKMVMQKMKDLLEDEDTYRENLKASTEMRDKLFARCLELDVSLDTVHELIKPMKAMYDIEREAYAVKLLELIKECNNEDDVLAKIEEREREKTRLLQEKLDAYNRMYGE